MSLGLNGSSAGGGTGEHAVGTYTGTGQVVTLEFERPPKAIFIQGKLYKASDTTGPGLAIWIDGQTLLFGLGGSTGWSNAVFSVSGGVTVSGNNLIVPYAFSRTGETYSYIAFF